MDCYFDRNGHFLSICYFEINVIFFCHELVQDPSGLNFNSFNASRSVLDLYHNTTALFNILMVWYYNIFENSTEF